MLWKKIFNIWQKLYSFFLDHYALFRGLLIVNHLLSILIKLKVLLNDLIRLIEVILIYIFFHEVYKLII